MTVPKQENEPALDEIRAYAADWRTDHPQASREELQVALRKHFLPGVPPGEVPLPGDPTTSGITLSPFPVYGRLGQIMLAIHLVRWFLTRDRKSAERIAGHIAQALEEVFPLP